MRILLMALVCILLVIINLLPIRAFADQDADKVREVIFAIEALAEKILLDDEVKAIVKTNGALRLRDSAPSKFLSIPGDEIMTLPENTYYKLVDQKRVDNLLSTQEWFKVQSINTSSDDEKKIEGWVYLGRKENGERYADTLSKEEVVKKILSPDTSELKNKFLMEISNDSMAMEVWNKAKNEIPLTEVYHD